MDRLVRGKKYKDPLTRLRLALLVLVEGILCPTCGTTNIRPEVVSKLASLDDFLKYPWGRESFLLTVRSTKSKTPMNYVQETMAIQGFSHAMVLVTVTACPSIIIKSGGGDPLADSALSTADIIRSVVERKLVVNLVTAKSVDQLGQGNVAQGGVDSGMQSGDLRGQSSKQPGHEPQPGENVPLDVPTLLRMAADAYEERVMPMFEGYVLSLKGHFNREVGVRRTDLQSATTSIRQLETSVTTEFENMKKLIKGPGYNDEEPLIGGGSLYRQYSPYRGPDHDVRDAFVPPAKRTQGHRVLSPDPPQPSVLQTEFSESAAVDVDSHGGLSGDKDTESMGPVPSNVEPPLAQSTGRIDHIVFEPMETHPHDSHEAPPQDPLPTVSESHTVPDVSGVVNQILSDAGISKISLAYNVILAGEELPHPSTLPSNVVGGQCQSSKFGTGNEQQELPHPSPAPANVTAGPSVSSKFVPENEKETISVGGETHGSDPVEEPSELGVEKNDEVDGSSNPSPSKFKGVGDVPAADDAAGAGARRVSKRKHNSPQRFSPSEPTVHKEATKKSTKNVPGNKQASKRAKKNAPASSNPTSPTRVLPVFIGGFNAFAPPTPANRDAFLKRLNAAEEPHPLSLDPPRPSVPHTKFTDSGPVDVGSHGVLPGDKDTASKGPVPSNEIPQTSTLPGDVVGGQCQNSIFDRLNEQELPRPSPAPATVAAGQSVSSKFVPLNEKETTSLGAETHGSGPMEEASKLGVEKNDDVDGSSNLSPTKFKGVGDVPAADDAAGDGGRRVSKRRHTSPQRFSPSEPTVRKEATKKGTKIVPATKKASKHAKKTANASYNPTPPTRVLPVFIGGFNAFTPPTQANRDAFLSVDDSSGSGYSISSLGPLFHCNGVCSHEALDRVVNLIRNRHDRLPSARFEFVPPSFFFELMCIRGNQREAQDSGPVDVDSHGVLPGDKDTASKGPVPSNEIPQTSTFPGDVVGGQCQNSIFDRLNEQLPRPYPAPATVAAGQSVSSKFVPLNEKETTSLGAETNGSDPMEEASKLGVEKNDDVDGSSNPSPTKFKGVGDGPAADDAAGDGGRRVSKRRHTSPQWLSPTEPTVRKEATKKGTKIVSATKKASKRAKKTANASSNPTPPTRVLPVFIGGFNAFAPPTQANRDAFLSVDDSSGSGYSISSLGPLFHCNGVCSHEALDRVVNLIRNRHDRLPFARFEFVPPSFFFELMCNYAGFEAIKEKHKFVFSSPLKPQFLHRPRWYTQQELPHPSPAPANVTAGPSVSSKFVPENEKETISVGGETHGSDPVEEPSELGVEKNDEVDGSSNPSPSKFKGVGDVPAADDAAGAGARRVSKRKHNSPQRFSPSEPTVHKEATKKSTKNVPGNKQASKRAKKNAPASSNPTSPTRVLPVFIGGFNAFAPPTPANRDAFLKRLNAAEYVRPYRWTSPAGSGYSISSLGPLFHCNGVCSHEALDRVVTFIRNRRDRLPSARFEFVPPSFFLKLMHNYAGFDAIKEKHKFVFSTPIKPQFMHRPGWYCLVPNPGEMNFRPFPISRIEVPVLLEHPGFSGVAALILLEMVAADQPLNMLSKKYV
ncbi:hypothetical protein F2Q70_00002493 [Brassica cretica]|uniref:DUF1985 domain-containing protein n=1 Tax=Brassica cretica TaxID=69181 RepID=A0A8S9IZC0_BRACR|nr:hypothetical protein F2Q70_00002493 [Brassica cretica]